MKYYIIIALIALVNINICQTARFGGDFGIRGLIGRIQDEYDYGDDGELFSPDDEDDKEDDSPKPIYDLKDARKLFEKFIKDFEKKYKDDQDKEAHYNNFLENLKEINRINSDKELSSTVDINLFTDYSQEEKTLLLGIPY
ncbi:unnamed protein product [Chrysodeixis includens]|uniref:Cathepsin propeptide inhibitor domain-containing protein n=1 Tax=Chrysodeixis includens TaxID=689277 RepID=A0A9P0BPW4_CHRIL|nr:unnamed protein product [Chrysodeixis includens]